MAQTTRTHSEATKTSQAARRTTGEAKKATEQAERTGEHAGRTAQALVTDSVYAAVGSVDQAVSTLRTLRARASEAPRAVQQRRQQVTSLVDKAEGRAKSLVSASPSELRQRLDGLGHDVAGEFDELASRGRGVVHSISRNGATRNALDQTSAARSQVKAAVTSLRKAAGMSAEAVDTAGDKLGQDKGEPGSQSTGASHSRSGGSSKSASSSDSGTSSKSASSSKSAGGSSSKSGGAKSGSAGGSSSKGGGAKSGSAGGSSSKGGGASSGGGSSAS